MDDIELAGQDKVTQYSGYIEFILERMGLSEALITNESKVSDFIDPSLYNDSELTDEGRKYLGHLSFILEVKVEVTDLMWEVAAKLEKAMS